MSPDKALKIEQIGIEALEEALPLLTRFFHEEGFLPPPEMCGSLEAMIRGPGSAVFLAYHRDQALGNDAIFPTPAD